jgi:hypothetical protein
MAKCYCVYNQCNGVDIHRNTRLEHRKKDEIARRNAALSAPSAPSVQTAIPQPRYSSPSIPSPPLAPAPELPPPSPFPSESGEGDLQSAVRDRSEAEERGRIYQEHTRTTLNAEDDIGDLEEEEPGEEEPGTSAPSEPQSNPLSGTVPRQTLTLHEVPSSDPRYPGENTPDPFRLHTTSTTTGSPSITLSSTSAPLYMLYLLVAWLHTQCKVAFSACGAVLVVVSHILLAAGVVLDAGQQSPYVTLKSVMSNVGIEPAFHILAVCPQCMEPHPSSTSPGSMCTRCESPLFKSTARRGRRARAPANDGANLERPLVQYPVMSVEAQLRAILAIPGMEDEMEHFRSVPRSPGVYNDMFDGRVPREIKGPDGRPFFENPVPPGSTELRVGLTLGFDW